MSKKRTSNARKEGAEQARKLLPELLDRAHQGQPTVITKRGKAYAALVPVSQLSGRKAGLRLEDLRGTGKKLWSRNAAAWVKKVRKEWD